MENCLSEKMQMEICEIADGLIEEKTKEIALLSEIRYAAENASLQKIRRLTTRFAGVAEEAFLEGKVLSVLARTTSRPSDYDYSAMGTTENFPCTLEHDGVVWEFYLPPTPSVKNGNIGNNVGRYTGYLVKNLIENYEKENGKIEMMDSAVIVLEYGLPDTELSKLYDSDNRDNKRILDAMTGTFYPDDNVLEIRTMHIGCKSDKAYTKVYVMEKDVFPVWINSYSH